MRQIKRDYDETIPNWLPKNGLFTGVVSARYLNRIWPLCLKCDYLLICQAGLDYWGNGLMNFDIPLRFIQLYVHGYYGCINSRYVDVLRYKDGPRIAIDTIIIIFQQASCSRERNKVSVICFVSYIK